jgi:hypothetical protein
MHGYLARWGIEDDQQSILFQRKQAEGESGPMQVYISHILDTGQHDESSFLHDVGRQSTQTSVMSPEVIDKKMQDQPFFMVARALIPKRLQEVENKWNEEQKLLRKYYQSFYELATTSFDPELHRRLKNGVSCVDLHCVVFLCHKRLSCS